MIYSRDAPFWSETLDMVSAFSQSFFDRDFLTKTYPLQRNMVDCASSVGVAYWEHVIVGINPCANIVYIKSDSSLGISYHV